MHKFFKNPNVAARLPAARILDTQIAAKAIRRDKTRNNRIFQMQSLQSLPAKSCTLEFFCGLHDPWEGLKTATRSLHPQSTLFCLMAHVKKLSLRIC